MLRRADPRFVLRNAVTGQRVERCRNSPSLILDFINQDYRTGLGSYYERHSFSDLISFTRAGSAMRWNAAGNLELVAANEPRFDHDPVTGQSLGPLIEEQRTNLCIDKPINWGGVRTSVSEGTVGPDGSTGALIEVTGSGGAAYRSFPGSYTVADSHYSVSAIVKRGSTAAIGFRCQTSFPNRVDVLYNFDTGVIAREYTNPDAHFDESVGAVSAKGLPGGFVLVVFSFKTTAILGAQIIFCGPADGSVIAGWPTSAAIGATTEIWHGQIELNPNASSIIRTSGAAETRSADMFEVSPGTFPDWFVTSPASIYCQYGPCAGVDGFSRLFELGGPDASEVVRVQRQNSANFYRVVSSSGAGTNTSDLPAGSFSEGGRIALSYGVPGSRGAWDGVLGSLGLGNLPSGIDQMHIANSRAGVNPNNVHMRDLRFYPFALSDSELQRLTA